MLAKYVKGSILKSFATTADVSGTTIVRAAPQARKYKPWIYRSEPGVPSCEIVTVKTDGHSTGELSPYTPGTGRLCIYNGRVLDPPDPQNVLFPCVASHRNMCIRGTAVVHRSLGTPAL